MKTLQEITTWDDAGIPNHIYFLSDDKSKLLAYIVEGTKKVLQLSVPIAFSTSRRKFIEVKNTFGFSGAASTNPTWSVTGSRGDMYTIEQTHSGGYICSCSGFKFRGKCKHIETFYNRQNDDKTTK